VACRMVLAGSQFILHVQAIISAPRRIAAAGVAVAVPTAKDALERPPDGMDVTPAWALLLLP
jgi:hypothetical protein